jgi:hypothetical protein
VWLAAFASPEQGTLVAFIAASSRAEPWEGLGHVVSSWPLGSQKSPCSLLCAPGHAEGQLPSAAAGVLVGKQRQRAFLGTSGVIGASSEMEGSSGETLNSGLAEKRG